MKESNWFKKGLVAGIIVLFIGVGVQPVFADASITAISNNEDDCNCQPISNLHLIVLERLSNKLDRLIDRLEVYIGIILILYKHNPEITEEFKELSNEITSLQESNDALKSVFEFGLKEEFCDALDYYIDILNAYFDYIVFLMSENPALIPFLYPLKVSLNIAETTLLIIWFSFCWYPFP